MQANLQLSLGKKNIDGYELVIYAPFTRHVLAVSSLCRFDVVLFRHFLFCRVLLCLEPFCQVPTVAAQMDAICNSTYRNQSDKLTAAQSILQLPVDSS